MTAKQWIEAHGGAWCETAACEAVVDHLDISRLECGASEMTQEERAFWVDHAVRLFEGKTK